jgi:CAP12/Pycsar effector protein, TIR domain
MRDMVSSEGTMESLVNTLDSYDFAILVVTPDDLIESRGEKREAPRDNVLIELGLFIGGLGRTRTFIVVDRTARLKLPSDLAGITPATYQPPTSGTLQAAVGPACTAIEQAVKKMGKIRGGLPVKITGSYFTDYRLGKGIGFTITNIGGQELPPFKVGLFHSRHGSWFLFNSEKNGPLLPDQKREFRCSVISDGRIHCWFPKFTPIEKEDTPGEDDSKYEFRLVLEDSEKVLYTNKRIGLGLVKLLRLAYQRGDDIGGGWDDWNEICDSGQVSR